MHRPVAAATSGPVHPARAGAAAAGEPAIADAMWRAIEVFRLLAVLYACYLAWAHRDAMARPGVAVAALATLATWSIAMAVLRRRSPVVVVTELALAAAAILATLAVEGVERARSGVPTLPSIWPAAGVLSAAVLGGWRAGLAAAALIALVDVVEAGGTPSPTTGHNIVLLVLAGGLVGFSVEAARDAHRRLAAALAAHERLSERERLARAVHDGVLQTLAFISRRGGEIGGPADELARMAGAQERSLRALVSQTADPPGNAADLTDLRAALAALEGDRVRLAAPADPVWVPATTGRELTAAVTAALDNVARHAGNEARAWVLIEDLDQAVVVTVRDDGCGMPSGRLAQAAREGRLGVAASIVGRVGDLGGECDVESRPGSGTTVRLSVPRNPPADG